MKSFILSFLLHSLAVLLLFFSPWTRARLPEKIRPVFLLSLQKYAPAWPSEKERKAAPKSKPHPAKEEKRLEIILGKRIEERLKEVEKRIREKEKKKPIEAALQEEALPAPPAPTVITEAEFTFSWYLTLLEKKITEAWHPPGGPLSAGKEVILSFTLAKDGRVTDILVAETSGWPAFDHSALRAIEEMDDLPPLPSNWDKEKLSVIVKLHAV